MNVTELRAALRERADTVAQPDPAARVAGVRARVRVARRHRVAGAAALTVGALAVAGAVQVLPDQGAPPAAPTTGTALAPLPVIEHESFLSRSGPYELVAAEVGDLGQDTLTLTVPATDGELLVSMACYGVSGPSDNYWVSGWIGDQRPARPDSQWCGGDPTEPVVPGVVGHAPGPWTYDDELTVRPAGQPTTIHLELTQELDENGERLTNPDDLGTYTPARAQEVVLGAAAYRVADPVTTVAGEAIPARVGLSGQDYAYVEHRQSEPGQRDLTWTLPPSPRERYYDIVYADVLASGAPGIGVAVALDGEHCRAGYAFASGRDGGCLLSAGVPHTIAVTIPHEPPATAALAIVLYEATG